MTGPDGDGPPLPHQVTVRLDRRRRRQLREMVEYILAIHHHIDPLRFDIDPAFLERLQTLLPLDGWDDTPLAVSYDSRRAIEDIADAAGTYTDREYPPLMRQVTSDDCLAFYEWFTKATQGLYGSPDRPN